MCAEYANVAGPESPKCVWRSGPCAVATGRFLGRISGLSIDVLAEMSAIATGRLDVTRASAKLIPLHSFAHDSATRKLLSDGPHGVIVWPSERASA